MFIGDVTGPASSGWLDYAKTLLVLGGVSIAAMVAARFWLPKLKRMSTSTTDHIQVFARCALEPKRSLYIVKAGKCAVLLGTSETGIHFMTALDPNDFCDGPSAPEPSPGGRTSFAHLLRSFRSGKVGPTQ